MEIQLTSQKRDSKASEPDSPMIKEVDDFPTFDEVFDKESLLKFFKEQDSASLQSLFSPQKDTSTVDETRSLAEERDIQLSPNNQNVSRSHNQTPINKSNLSFSFNFNSNPKIFEVKRLARGSSNLSPQSGTSASTQASGGSPIDPSPIKSSDFHLLGSQNPTFPISKASHYPQEETNLQRLIREKKVFRIIRNQKPVTITKRTSKRRASMPLDEFHPSPKQINSQSSYQVNFYNSPSLLSRSASHPHNTQSFADISKYFGNIPNNTPQNLQNIFNMYPLQNVNQPYENVNYLFNSSKY